MATELSQSTDDSTLQQAAEQVAEQVLQHAEERARVEKERDAALFALAEAEHRLVHLETLSEEVFAQQTPPRTHAYGHTHMAHFQI